MCHLCHLCPNRNSTGRPSPQLYFSLANWRTCAYNSPSWLGSSTRPVAFHRLVPSRSFTPVISDN